MTVMTTAADTGVTDIDAAIKAGDLAALVRMVVAAGADGVFTDDPALVLSALGR